MAEQQSWTYDPRAPRPIWVFQRFHKLGDRDVLESVNHGTLYPGDTVHKQGDKIWIDKRKED